MDRLGCVVRQGYGMTETSPVTHSSPAPPRELKFGSVGVPAPNTECKIIDLETGETLPPGERGEVCVRGPQVMKGYLNSPEATCANDRSRRLAAHRRHRLCGRRRPLLHRRSREGADQVQGFPGAAGRARSGAAVASVHRGRRGDSLPDDEAGEVPKAIVVLKQETEAQPILDYVAATRRAAQANPLPGVCRQDPEISVRKDPAARAGGTPERAKAEAL